VKLPNGERAIVDIRKLRDYCLNANHDLGKHKARVFASVGIGRSDAGQLREALLLAARDSGASLGALDAYGQRYIIDFELVRSGRAIGLRSSWIILSGKDIPKLTTCYVLWRRG
jgi:hypothetical protein